MSTMKDVIKEIINEIRAINVGAELSSLGLDVAQEIISTTNHKMQGDFMDSDYTAHASSKAARLLTYIKSAANIEIFLKNEDKFKRINN